MIRLGPVHSFTRRRRHGVRATYERRLRRKLFTATVGLLAAGVLATAAVQKADGHVPTCGVNSVGGYVICHSNISDLYIGYKAVNGVYTGLRYCYRTSGSGGVGYDFGPYNDYSLREVTGLGTRNATIDNIYGAEIIACGSSSSVNGTGQYAITHHQ